MRNFKASILIALTLLASLPICCCLGKTLAEAGVAEPVHSCCAEPSPIESDSNCPDCKCPERAAMADPAPEVLGAVSQVGIKVTPPTFFSDPGNPMTHLAPELARPIRQMAQPPPGLAMSAHQHCVVFALFQV